MAHLGYMMCCIALVCHILPCCGQTWNDSVTLMTDMLEKYQKNHRPILDQSKALVVSVSFEMVFLQSLDEVTGKFSAFGIFALSWIDEKIVWNPADYGGVWSQLYNVKDVWYPSLVATSSYDKVEDLADDWMTVRILYSGVAIFTPGVLLKSSCAIDVTYYPFDTQECYLTFTPWGLWPNEIKIVGNSPYAASTYYSEGGEWRIVENATFVDDANNLYIKFKLQRKPLFAVINIIMPIVLMSALNVLVFVLPTEAGERISFAITVLLSTAVFMTLVADNLPKTSEPMSILAYFLLVNLSASALMCVATILNLRVYFKKESHTVPSWVKRMVRTVNCKSRFRTKEHEKNIVSPIDISAVTEAANEDTQRRGSDAEEPITWQDAAAAIDKILIISFVFAFVMSTVVFVVILVKNKGALGEDED